MEVVESTVVRPRPGTFFTSDLHLFHDKVAKLRGFPDWASHDEWLTGTWRRHVRKDAVVWVLGDLTGGGHLNEALHVLNELPGRKRLVLGNHDPAHPLNLDAHKYMPRMLQAFEQVTVAAKVKVDGRSVMLSHFPYVGDSGPVDRHTSWRLRDEGRPLLHGHTHQTQPSLGGDHVISVGWDAWWRPVHLDEVTDLLRRNTN